MNQTKQFMQYLLLVLVGLASAISVKAADYDFKAENYYGQKMSGYLRSLAQESNTISGNVRRANDNPTSVCALMKVNASADAYSVAEKYQCKVMENIGDIYIVQIPVNQLEALSLDDNVLRIEAHEMPRPTMNDVPARIGADKVWSGQDLPQAYSGAGVVAGIVDVGFDFLHPMFFDIEGLPRIHRYYDTNKIDNDGEYYVYNTDELTDMKHSQQAISQIHGTHVASIMAGSRVEGTRDSYIGVAFDSDIVATEVSLTSANLIFSFYKIFQYADSIRQPCVINLSAGAPDYLTDPHTLVSEAINTLLGKGHIIVTSVGNEGGLYPTIRKPKGINELRASFVKATETDKDNDDYNFSCDLLASHSFELCFGTCSMSRHFVDSVIISTDSLDMLNCDTLTKHFKLFEGVQIKAVKSDLQQANMNIYHFEIKTPEILLDHFLYLLGENLEIIINGVDSCKFHTYSPVSFGPSWKLKDIPDGYANCFSHEYAANWPGVIEDIIAVGALKTKNDYTPLETKTADSFVVYCQESLLSSFSSWGPTWDNRIKPDVVAPGEYIFGAYNQFSDTSEADKSSFFDAIVDVTGNEHHIIGLSGTSMASPIVAGVIALWLQAKPDLTPAEIKEVLSMTCRHPTSDEDYPNIRYGYGEIDAYAGLLYVLNLPSAIRELSLNQPNAVRFLLSEGRLSVVYADSGVPFEGQATIRVYTTEGKMVATNTGNSIDLASLPAGVYAVQFNSQKKECTGSTLIRL